MEEKIFFSIIIPVYNVEQFLKECIDSVLEQTFKNYEIILIDDGSTDNSGNICNEYLKKYKNIKVIHKSNGGLSSARNAGIDNAQGQYIIFLDSDDYWDSKTALSEFYNILNVKKIDVLLFGIKKYNDITSQYIKSPQFNDTEDIIEMVKNNIFKASATNKILKTEQVKRNNLKFTPNLLSEDVEWCGKMLEKFNTFYYYSKQIYVYRQREGSISHSNNVAHLLDIAKQCQEALIKYSTRNRKNIVLSYYAYEYCTLLASYSRIIASKKNNEIYKEIKKGIKLLDYDLSKKVKKISKCYKILGLNMTMLILKIFMHIKSR